MRPLLLLLPVLLSACGMKGDLYEVPPTADPVPDTAGTDADQDGRKTIPSTPAPPLTR